MEDWNLIAASRLIVGGFAGALSARLRLLAVIFVLSTSHIVYADEMVGFTIIFLVIAMIAELRQS